MKIYSYLILALFIFVSCNQRPIRPDISAINLLRGELRLCGDSRLGKIDFSLSCNPATKASFNLGVALLHSFEYEEAEKAFVKSIDEDPGCAMAYWGVAMSNFHALWLQSGTDYLEKGEKILEAARPLPKGEKETDYLDAIGVFYADWKTIDRQTRIDSFLKAMESLSKKYDTDTEAAIFYALALCAAANPADKTYANQKKSGAILEALLKAQPDHPGITHYLIHNYDSPELAELALPMARRYAEIAPASAHAQHMPSHIFTRLGLWQESIASNLNSTESAQCYAESLREGAHWDEELHGMDYLVYAYLQTGDTDKAIAQLEYLHSFEEVFPSNFKIAYAVAAIPSRVVLENRDWEGAAQLKLPELAIPWAEHPWEAGIYHFTRALGALHTGNTVSARQELDTLELLQKKLVTAKDAYKANQVLIQVHTARAWLAFANGEKGMALSEMEEAARMESLTAKHPVTPGEVLPASELLGDLLLAYKQPMEALKAYESNLATHPNRFNGIYGAAVAADQMGDGVKAANYYKKLLDLSAASGSSRMEITQAKKYLEKSI